MESEGALFAVCRYLASLWGGFFSVLGTQAVWTRDVLSVNLSALGVVPLASVLASILPYIAAAVLASKFGWPGLLGSMAAGVAVTVASHALVLLMFVGHVDFLNLSRQWAREWEGMVILIAMGTSAGLIHWMLTVWHRRHLA